MLRFINSLDVFLSGPTNTVTNNRTDGGVTMICYTKSRYSGEILASAPEIRSEQKKLN